MNFRLIENIDHPQSEWLGFFCVGGKKQRQDSALIGSGETGCQAPGLKTPNPIAVFHLVRLAEFIGSRTDHAKNDGNMQLAMITEW